MSTRKFKLVKEFPLSPEEGTVVVFENTKQEEEGIYDVGAMPTLLLTDCTQFPEFWEEVKEQEFEILEFTSPVTNLKHILREDGKYNPNGLSKEELMESSAFSMKISKIKRLSDNEVFSLGDKLDRWEANIIRFDYNKEIIRVISDAKGKGLVASEVSWQLKYCKKAPKALFITEDGVDIYEGNDYWLVRSNFTLWKELPCHTENYGNPKPLKAFSTKQVAEKYIDENKPIYSKKQIKDAIEKARYGSTLGYELTSTYHLNLELNL